MSAKDWGEAAYEGLKGLALIIAGGLFTHLRYRRTASKTRLGMAEDSGGIAGINGLRKHAESVQSERDALWAELKRSEAARGEMKDQLGAAVARGIVRDEKVQGLTKDVLILTRIVLEDRPHLAPLLQRSGFVGLDETKPR